MWWWRCQLRGRRVVYRTQMLVGESAEYLLVFWEAARRERVLMNCRRDHCICLVKVSMRESSAIRIGDDR